jgi:hypothetical protein
MPLFDWFSRKKPAPLPPADRESSGLGHVDATVPLASGSIGRSRSSGGPPGSAANRKTERLERREQLYAIVRESMTRAGVLSSSYKFKVLSLDSRGRQYLVMMDLPHEHAGETGRLAEIEESAIQSGAITSPDAKIRDESFAFDNSGRDAFVERIFGSLKDIGTKLDTQ